MRPNALKPIGNVPPPGLTAAEARALREGVDAALDALLLKASTTMVMVGGSAVERYVVDIVRRWAARLEEELFPGQAGDLMGEVRVGATGGFCPTERCENSLNVGPQCGPVTRRVEYEYLVANEWNHAHARWLCARCAGLTIIREPPTGKGGVQGARLTVLTFEALGLPPRKADAVDRDEHGRELCPTCQGARTSADRFCGTCSPGAQEVACSCCGFRSRWSGAIWHDADGKTVCEGCWVLPGAGAG